MNVAIAPTSVSVGQTVVASATGLDQSGRTIALGPISWSISPSTIATVNASGLITSVAPGQGLVVANVGGKQGSAAITITTGVAAVVVLSPTNVVIDVGQATQVSATVRDVGGNVLSAKIVSWTASDASVVGSTSNGNTTTIRGVAAGSAVITASVDGVSGTMAVTVRPPAPRPVASITVSPSAPNVAVGAYVRLTATLRDAQGNVLTGRALSWATSNTAIATGTASGNTAEILGVAVGTATITASSEGVVRGVVVTVTSGGGSAIPLTCSGVAGGHVGANDGQYLGRLTNQYDSQSILNIYGSYGSQYSSTSMYNQYSAYGSLYNALSAYNVYASSPPILFVSGQAVAFVSKNTLKTPRVDPDALRSCSFP